MGLFFHVFPLHRAAEVADLHSVSSKDENSLQIDEKLELKNVIFSGALTVLFLCGN